jgi:hypothetical protein
MTIIKRHCLTILGEDLRSGHFFIGLKWTPPQEKHKFGFVVFTKVESAFITEYA